MVFCPHGIMSANLANSHGHSLKRKKMLPFLIGIKAFTQYGVYTSIVNVVMLPKYQHLAKAAYSIQMKEWYLQSAVKDYEQLLMEGIMYNVYIVYVVKILAAIFNAFLTRATLF